MAAVDVYNGILLAAGTSVLPDGLDYAYVVHPDYPAGKPLVAKGYNFRTVRKGGNNPTPNGPRYVEKELLPAPLPLGWYANSATLMYEQRNAAGIAVATTKARPVPPTIAIMRKMSLVHQLRWGYEISVLQPAGQGDSDSYLTYREVKQRDLDFNAIFGIENNHLWLSVSKDVPEYAHEGEGDGAFTARELADALNTELETGADSRKCLDRVAYWKLMGGGLVVDETYVNATGNHAEIPKWYQGTLQAYAQDAIQIIEWYGGRIYSIEGGTGVYKAVEGGPDKTFLCLEIHNRTPGSGPRKLNKGADVPNAPLHGSILDVVIAMLPSQNFSTETRNFPVGTPESLQHGLGLICEQVQIARPKKRKAAGALTLAYADNEALRQENTALRSIVTLKTFEDALLPLQDKDALMEFAKSYVGHVDVVDFYETAFASSSGSGYVIRGATKKVFAKCIFDAFMLPGDA